MVSIGLNIFLTTCGAFYTIPSGGFITSYRDLLCVYNSAKFSTDHTVLAHAALIMLQHLALIILPYSNVVNFISNAINEGQFCIGIFLDLRKAFDVCDHEILFKKLKSKGITGRSLEWFKSYLGGRRQVVEVNGHKSTPESIDMSVIQGSILGPILFLVYIDDLPSSSLLETFLFADDTQGLKAGKNLPELIDCVKL